MTNPSSLHPDALCCGLDIGTTNLKVVLVDVCGRTRWSRSVPAPRVSDGIGSSTNPTALLATVEDMIIEGWRAVGCGRPLLAVAAGGIGEDGMRLGPDLLPTGFAIPWFDTRAKVEAAELAGSNAASPRLGIKIDAARSASKWLWLSRHRPADVAEGGIWVALADYPAVAWTGRPFMSETLAARTAAYDVYSRNWHPAMLAAASAPPLPDILSAGTDVGTLHSQGLQSAGVIDDRTRVVAGGHDHPVAASYIRRFAPDAVVDSTGTAELIYGETTRLPEPRLDPLLAFSVPIAGGPGLAFLGVQELAAAMEPFRHSQHGDLVATLLAASTLPGKPPDSHQQEPDGTCGQEHPVYSNAALQCCRVVMERVAYVARDMIDAVDPCAEVYATGGWSRSDAFLEFRASVFGRPVFRFDVDELTGAGAALIALGAVPGSDPGSLTRPSVRSFAPRLDWAESYRRVSRARN